MPQSKERIAAVLVTYNRKLLLHECLDSLLGQSRPPEAVYVIDNHSSDGTYDSLLGRELIAPMEDSGRIAETVRSVPSSASPDRRLDIHYVRLPENTGGAGGFHEGVTRAVEAGFDWLWMMDDDVLAAPDALEILMRQVDAMRGRGQETFLLNSLVCLRDQPDGDRLAFPLQELAASGDPKIGVYHWRLSEVRHLVENGLYPWVCPFNGTFVPARVVAEIGPPNREFFIWGDERDFLWRAARRFRVYTAVDSRVYHPPCRDPVFDWKQYYNIRNAIVLNRRFRYARLRNLKLIVIGLSRGLRNGPNGLNLVLRAIRDGLAGRLGKREDLHP